MSDTVTVTVPVRYKCFPVPDEVFVDLSPQPKQAGIQWLPREPISDIAADALDALAAAWLDQLYASVSRSSPFRIRPTTVPA